MFWGVIQSVSHWQVSPHQAQKGRSGRRPARAWRRFSMISRASWSSACCASVRDPPHVLPDLE